MEYILRFFKEFPLGVIIQEFFMRLYQKLVLDFLQELHQVSSRSSLKIPSGAHLSIESKIFFRSSHRFSDSSTWTLLELLWDFYPKFPQKFSNFPGIFSGVSKQFLQKFLFEFSRNFFRIFLGVPLGVPREFSRRPRTFHQEFSVNLYMASLWIPLEFLWKLSKIS